MLYYLQHHCFPFNIIRRRKPSSSSQHSFASPQDDDDNDNNINTTTPEQYHISPHHYTYKASSSLSPSSILKLHHHQCFCSIEEITSWLYLSSFGKVLFTFAITYISFVTIFASFLFLLNWYYEYHLQRECMDGWDVAASGYVNYEATFSLSWTTFSSKFGYMDFEVLFCCWMIYMKVNEDEISSLVLLFLSFDDGKLLGK